MIGRVFCALLTLSAIFTAGCGDDAADAPQGRLHLDNGSFELSGEASLDGWTLGNSDLAASVRDAPAGGGSWCLQLTADWSPTSAYAVAEVTGARAGDILRLSAWLRAVGSEGGGILSLQVGQRPPSSMLSRDTTWRFLSVVDTVREGEQQEVRAICSSLNTEIIPRVGRFDLVHIQLVNP